MDTQTQETDQITEHDESEAALAQGFSQATQTPEPQPTTTEQPSSTSTEGAAPTGDPEPVETPTEPVDEWANVPAKVKAEFDSMREQLGQIGRVSERLRNFEGAIGGLTQLTKELKAAVVQRATTAAETQGKAAPTQAQLEWAAKTPERWKTLKEDFPDWGEFLAEELSDIHAKLAAKEVAQPDTTAIKGEITAEVRKHLDQAVKDAEERAEQRARTHAYLDFHHEGWETEIKSADFEAWYAAQPKDIQALSASDDKKDAKRMLDLFATHKKRQAERAENDKRLKRVIAPQGTVATPAVEDEDAEMDQGFRSVLGNR